MVALAKPILCPCCEDPDGPACPGAEDVTPLDEAGTNGVGRVAIGRARCITTAALDGWTVDTVNDGTKNGIKNCYTETFSKKIMVNLRKIVSPSFDPSTYQCLQLIELELQ